MKHFNKFSYFLLHEALIFQIREKKAIFNGFCILCDTLIYLHNPLFSEGLCKITERKKNGKSHTQGLLHLVYCWNMKCSRGFNVTWNLFAIFCFYAFYWLVLVPNVSTSQDLIDFSGSGSNPITVDCWVFVIPIQKYSMLLFSIFFLMHWYIFDSLWI